MTTRRGFLTGLSGFIACAPAIVRASSLMPVKAYQPVTDAFLPLPYAYDVLQIHLALGYAITRQALEDNLRRPLFTDYAFNPAILGLAA